MMRIYLYIYFYLTAMGKKNVVICLISIMDAGNCQYGVDLARQLAASLLSVLVSCGSVRISFSERTPQKV